MSYNAAGKRWSAARLLQFAIDLSVLGCAFIAAYLLRFDFAIPQKYARLMLLQLPWVVVLQWGMLLGLGTYRRVWRFISLVDVPSFLNAFLFSAGPVILLRFLLPRGCDVFCVPLSVTLMATVISFVGVLGVRVLRRAAADREDQRRFREQERSDRISSGGLSRKQVVLIGAGRAGAMAAREIKQQQQAAVEVVGFLDDDPNKYGGMVGGIPVLGPAEMVGELSEKGMVDEAVITMANAPRRQIMRIVRLCEESHLKTRIIPPLHEILSGKVSIANIRSVEIEDVLGREQVVLDEEVLCRFVVGKRILVTGAGGSIGSEMVRQLHGFGPSDILLVERCEYALYEIDREMRARGGEVRVMPRVADVADEGRMQDIFARFKPHVVIHAAAHKHVPLMELNVCDAIKNNVLGTRIVAELAGRHGVDVFVLVSTDKAVNPTSIMGASKRLAELAVQDLDGRCGSTRYVAVRFGNVLGSTGSVIPLFREQIRRGGPVTVTHPEMRRYFMTVQEASRLVLQAAAMGMGGEICVLDMGEPVCIADLAREMIRLSGLRPGEDITIEYTGLRPGEKMFEELCTDEEKATRTRHPKIFIGRIAKYSPADVARMLGEMKALSARGDEAGIRRFIDDFLPEAMLAETVCNASLDAEKPVP